MGWTFIPFEKEINFLIKNKTLIYKWSNFKPWSEQKSTHTHTRIRARAHTRCYYCTRVALPGYRCHSKDTNDSVHVLIILSQSSLGLWGGEKHFPI